MAGMQHPAYEYWGLKASTWDLVRGDNPRWDDRAFYLQVIQQSGEPVLDVGCGTGRLLLDYLLHGIDIDGVDDSPEMLERCRTKAGPAGLRPRLFQQAMQSLDLPRRYRTIIVPASSFQLLVEPQHALGAMRCFWRQLEPGGTLAMPFVTVYTEHATTDTVVEDWRCVGETVMPEDGTLVRLWSSRVLDLRQRLEHIRERFEVIRDGQILLTEEHTCSPATRWYTQQEAEDLYAAAGFIGIRLLSGFSFRPASREDTLFSALGVKA